MILELGVGAVLSATGIAIFGRFEEKTALWRRLLKWAIYFGLIAILSGTAGRVWALGWAFALPLVGLCAHFIICARWGIHPLKATPRDKYYRLRGWELTSDVESSDPG